MPLTKPERVVTEPRAVATGSYIQPPIYNFADGKRCTTQLSAYIRSLTARGSVTSNWLATGHPSFGPITNCTCAIFAPRLGFPAQEPADTYVPTTVQAGLSVD